MHLPELCARIAAQSTLLLLTQAVDGESHAPAGAIASSARAATVARTAVR